MSNKTKLALLVVSMILIFGCGKVNDKNSSMLEEGIKKYNVLVKTVQDIDNKEMLCECKGTVNGLLEERESYLTTAGNMALSTWVGEYEFEESTSGPPPMGMSYEIEIYEEEERYFAEIEIMGQTTMASAKAEVDGDENEIRLLFREYLPDHVIGLKCDKGDVVLRFVRQDEELYTYWGEIQPLLYENEESGRAYFVKEADNDPEELSRWIGEYTFSEVLDNPESKFERVDYSIKIYQENNGFFAEVRVDEEKTYIRVKAEVRGNGEKICLFLLETLPGHMSNSIDKEGSILLKFRENGGKIYTDWGEIVPMLEENQEYGKRYFEKAQ